MGDDWKGEHFLKAKPDRLTENKRLASQTWHNRRKKLGTPAPSAKSHSMFVRSAFNWVKPADEKT